MRKDTGSTRRYFDDVAEGDELPPLVKEISLMQIVMYGTATWDFMRIHYDTEFARAQGFQQVFADGQMLGAFLAQLVGEWAGEPGALRRLGVPPVPCAQQGLTGTRHEVAERGAGAHRRRRGGKKELYFSYPYVDYPDLTHDNDYRFCNSLGAEAMASGLDGLVTPSARRSNGTNLPVFQRRAIRNPVVHALVAVTLDPSSGEVALSEI